MQAFFKTHKFLLENLQVPIRRGLMSKVNWEAPLIGILGARGVGKTNFLLDWAKHSYGYDKTCLYVNLNHLSFSSRSIVSFADEFQKTGGQRLILDQVFKYPGWMEELVYCHDNFPGLKIIFSGTPLMYNAREESGLEGRAAIYTLEGYTLREFINQHSGNNFPAYLLEEIIQNHVDIASDIVSRVKPLAYFADYTHRGYYPFFLERRNYLENLLKNINLVLEIDVGYLQQVELKYLPKLRKLLYLVACSAPFQPNVSRLSVEVETSRATIINYLRYLSQARLVYLLNEDKSEGVKKPSIIYMQNPNLLYSAGSGEVDNDVLNKTFFCNQLSYRHRLNYTRDADFMVEGSYFFNVGKGSVKGNPPLDMTWQAVEMLEIGSERAIPLWLFGFLD